MGESILEIVDLNKSYDKFSINNLNLKINEGEIIGIIGANGAGKSTIIKSILNIINTDSGRIKFKGEDAILNEENFKKEIGYVGDNNKFYNDITLNALYKFVKESYKDKWDDEYFYYLIKEKFELDMKKRFKELSKGMLMKFMIAIALSHNPSLLILDEPTSGLDPIVREELLNILKDMNKKNDITIFMSSHIIEDIESICHRILYIDSGKILLDINKNDTITKYKKININNLNLDEKDIFRKFSIANDEYYLFEVSKYKKEIHDKEKLVQYFKDLSLSEILIYLRNREVI